MKNHWWQYCYWSNHARILVTFMTLYQPSFWVVTFLRFSFASPGLDIDGLLRVVYPFFYPIQAVWFLGEHKVRIRRSLVGCEDTRLMNFLVLLRYELSPFQFPPFTWKMRKKEKSGSFNVISNFTLLGMWELGILKIILHEVPKRKRLQNWHLYCLLDVLS